jgi:hypothetical protein
MKALPSDAWPGLSATRLADKAMHKRGLLSFKGKERPSREIAAVFSLFSRPNVVPDEAKRRSGIAGQEWRYLLHPVSDRLSASGTMQRY